MLKFIPGKDVFLSTKSPRHFSILNRMRLFYANISILKGRQYLLSGINIAKILNYLDYLFGLVIFEYYHSNGIFVFFHNPTLAVCLLIFNYKIKFYWILATLFSGI